MIDNKQQNKIFFNEIKPKILAALQANPKVEIKESVSLVDGFVSQPISMELSNSVMLGGPMIPMIMLVGNESGQIYIFALKAILKDIEI